MTFLHSRHVWTDFSTSQIPPWRLESGWGGGGKAHVEKRPCYLWIVELFKQLLHRLGIHELHHNCLTRNAAPGNSSFPHLVATVSWFLSIHMLILNSDDMISKTKSHKQLNKGRNVPDEKEMCLCISYAHTQSNAWGKLFYNWQKLFY